MSFQDIAELANSQDLFNARRRSSIWTVYKRAYQTRFTQPGMQWHRKVRFLTRSLLHFQSSSHWFALVQQSPLSRIAEAEPCFLDIIHRPFFDRRLDPNERAALLTSHYNYFYKAFNQDLIHTVMRGKGWQLGSVFGKSTTGYDVVLRRVGQFDKEGCLCLQFLEGDNALLTLTFSFATENGQVRIKLGGIQGGHDSREGLKQATQALFGLQPRLLLIWVVRQIAAKLGASSIEAVSQENHIYQSERYKSRKNIQIDYDELWRTAGGERQSNGLYAIPVFEKTIPLEDRPSHKRAQYRKRALMLSDMQQSVMGNLHLSAAFASPLLH